MRIALYFFNKSFEIDVLPTDTVWTLKWKIYENKDIQEYCHCHKGQLPLILPSPDDQMLWTSSPDVRLANCEKSLESYSIDEGTEIVCYEKPVEGHIFRSTLDVLRKKTTKLSLSNGFAHFLWLKHLAMHCHELSSFESEIAWKSHSVFAGICMVHSFSSLKKLHLGRIQNISDDGWTQIIDALETNCSLKEVNFHDCEIGVTCAIRIGQMLEMNHSLIVFDISYNRGIGDEGCTRIAEGLESNTTLKKLHLSDCGIKTNGAFAIGQMLEKNASIVDLHLCGNEEIGDEGWIRIAEGLKMNTSLRKLDVMNCHVGSKGAGKLLQLCHSLPHLDLRGNRTIGDEGCVRIAEGLEMNTSLKTLSIRMCRIGSRGITRFAKALEKSRSLISLCLGGNSRIGDEGCVQIAEALMINTALKKLDLWYCGIGYQTSVKIRKMLEINSSLVRLDLRSNHDIGDEGCIQIAEGLEKNTSLKELDLCDCGIETNGAFRMGKMLEGNTSLRKLSLGENPGIGNEGKARIAEGLELNSTLQELDLYATDREIGSEDVMKRIEFFVERNRSSRI